MLNKESLNDNNNKRSGSQMGCDVMVTNRLFLGLIGEFSMEKES